MRNRREEYPTNSMRRRWDIDAEEGFGFEVVKDVDDEKQQDSEESKQEH